MRVACNCEVADALMDSPILRSTLDEFDITFRHRSMTEAEGAGYSRGNVGEAVLAYFTEYESATPRIECGGRSIRSATAPPECGGHANSRKRGVGR